MRNFVYGTLVALLLLGIVAWSLRLHQTEVKAQEEGGKMKILDPITGTNCFFVAGFPVNSTFTAEVYVANITGMIGWQVCISWNNSAVNFHNAWIPDDSVLGNSFFAPSPFVEVDGDLACLLYGANMFPLSPVDVPQQGLLCKINFTIALQPMCTNLTFLDRRNPDSPSLDTYVIVSSFDNTSTVVPVSFEQASVFGRYPAYLVIASTDGGTTDPVPGEYLYLSGQEASVRAVPDALYEFSHWELNGVDMGSEKSCVVIMNLNYTLRAIFVLHQPVTWIVDQSGGGDFHTIEEAIGSPNIAYGDIIFVKSGVYYEHVVLGKWLTLIGESRDTTIIDGSGTGTVVTLFGNISRFTIRNGDYGVQVKTLGLSPQSTGCRIEGNRIVNNVCGGILLEACADNTICENIVENNTLFGIHMWEAADNTITNNSVLNNGQGIDFYSHTYANVLRSNSMTGNKYNFGIITRGDTQNYLFLDWDFMDNDVDVSNTVNGKPICYWNRRSNQVVPTNAGYVFLCNCRNVTLDNCNLSHNLQGVLLFNTEDVHVTNNSISHNAYGLYLFNSSRTTILGNELRDNVNGIYLDFCTRDTTMRNNSIDGGQANFGMYPGAPQLGFRMYPAEDLSNDIDGSNTVDGKQIVYWIGQHNRRVPADAGYVLLVNCTNILVEGLNLSNNVQGVFVAASNNTMIVNNRIANSVYAIDVKYVGYWFYQEPWKWTVYSWSFSTVVRGNTLVNNGVAMRLFSDFSTISNNTLLGNPLGIDILASRNSTISNNLVVASRLSPNPMGELFIFHYPDFVWERSTELTRTNIGGIVVGGSYNYIYCNTVADSYLALSMMNKSPQYFGERNKVFHNNFINNSFLGSFQAWDWRSNNWDDGYPSGGNYWSDYGGNDTYGGVYQNETGSDGIGDRPEVVLGVIYGRDRYPLMEPYSPLTGDVNGDKKVTMEDVVLELDSFGAFPMNRRWNPLADVNGDAMVNMEDISLTLMNFGQNRL